MNLSTLTSKDLAQIAKLLKQKEVLQARIGKVDQQLSAFEGGKPATTPVVTKKGGMSAAGRAAIAAAQRARWAKVNKGKKAGKPAKKHKMSAAGRAAIAAAQKARWAKVKKGKAPF